MNSFAQQLRWQPVSPQTNASFRGLSIVSDNVAWVSGSTGWIGRTTNGGKQWTFSQVRGFEKYDFRSLYAFDAQTALIANAGAPAYILYTSNGGADWQTVYTNEDPNAFFDGMDFWNAKEGVIYGDPINGRMLLLRTSDGGHTWAMLPDESRPLLAEGEASFAASGTAIRCMDKGTVVIATGGNISRLWISFDKAVQWKPIAVPVLQGASTTGMFSVAYRDVKKAIVVGGDYKIDTLRTNHVFYTTDGGQHWKAPTVPTRGFRECVTYVTDRTVLATGPSGTDVSYDGGVSWKSFSDEKGFHVLRKARTGSLMIAAGAGGKISLIR